MIKDRRYIVVLALSALCLNCSKNPQPDNPQPDNPLLGNEISFDTSMASYETDPDSPDTKLTMQFHNRVYKWDDGDKMAVVNFSAESGNEQRAEYSFSADKWSSAAPIVWENAGAHDFYAVYPSTAAVTFDDATLGYADKAALLNVEIPKNQNNSNLGTTYSMVGAYHVDEPTDMMTFSMFPLVTVLRFVVTNQTGTSLRVVPTQLVGWPETSWFDGIQQLNLFGKYQVRSEPSDNSSIWGDNRLESNFVDFTEAPASRGLSLSMASTIQNNYATWGFQVYVVPHNNYKRFVLTVNLTKGGGTAQSKQITFTNGGNVFDPFRIHYLNVTVR